MSGPRFSVIVPTYNRPHRLASCLRALAALDYPPEAYEVVVVDDGSPTPLDAVVAPFQDTMALTLLRQANAGPAAARNAGAQAARGRFLAFTDDDCAPRPGWLGALSDALDREPAALVGGHTVNALHDNPYSEASQLLVSYLYTYAERRPEARMFTSNNFALMAAPFHALGAFDASFGLAAGEDRDFCDRWNRSGRPMRFAPEAVVEHSHALSLRSFVRQHLHYGRGAYRFHQFKAQRSGKGLRPDLSFYTGLLRYPLVHGRRHRWLTPALLLLTQVVNAVGYFSAVYSTRGEQPRLAYGPPSTPPPGDAA